MTTLKQLNTPQQHALGATVVAWAEQLGRLSEDSHGLTCTYMSATHRETAVQLAQWMREAGMHAHIDAVGNVVGRFLSTDPQARTLVTGSHYDTVRQDGACGGRLGVLAAIAVVRHLNDRGISLPFHLEVIAFAEHEGVRFGSTWLGASAVIGQFDPALLDLRDRDGVPLRDVLAEAGQDLASIDAMARDPSDLLGYVEVQLEHGPVLAGRQAPVGVVTSIAGSRRFQVRLKGVASHAGATPMALRRDAAAAAAEIVLYVEQRCADDQARCPDAALACTVGQLQVPNGSVNVIPGACDFSLEVQAAANATRDAAVADILAKIDSVCQSRHIQFAIEPAGETGSVPCAPWLMAQLSAAMERAGAPACALVSGGSHDAVPMARATDVAVLLARCGKGAGQASPADTLAVDDADVAARVLLDFLRHFRPKPVRASRKAPQDTAAPREYTE